MKSNFKKCQRWLQTNARFIVTLAVGFALAVPVRAQGGSPWENAVNVLQTAFTGPIAKGLALVAIVVGGLTFAFGEGGGKKTFAGIVFRAVSLRSMGDADRSANPPLFAELHKDSYAVRPDEIRARQSAEVPPCLS